MEKNINTHEIIQALFFNIYKESNFFPLMNIFLKDKWGKNILIYLYLIYKY